MPSRDELMQALRAADAAGDVPAAQAIARRLASAPQAGPELSGQPQGAGVVATPTPAPAGGQDSPTPFQPGDVASTYERMIPEWGQQAMGFFSAPKQAWQSLRQLGAKIGMGEAPSEQDIKDWRMVSDTGMLGNVAGNLAMTALPLGAAEKGLRGVAAASRFPRALGVAVPSAVSGAEAGLLQPTLEGESRLTNAALGAAAPLVLKAAARPLSGLVRTSDVGTQMFKEGFTPTVGQAGAGLPGKTFRALETLGEMIPGVGAVMEKGTGRVGRQILQRAGEEAAPISQVGVTGRRFAEEVPARGEYFRELSQQFDDAYDTLFKGKSIPYPVSLKSESVRAAEKAGGGGRMTGDARKMLGKSLDWVFPAQQGGRFGGPTLRAIKNRFTEAIDDASKMGGTDSRDIVAGLKAARERFFNNISNTFTGADLAAMRALDDKYAKSQLLSRAAAYTDVPVSGIEPRHLIQAVEAGTPQGLKVAGKGRYEDLSTLLKEAYMNPEVTGPKGALARRAAYATAGGLLGAGGTALGGMPILASMIGAAGLGVTEPGAKAILGQYGPQKRLAELLRNYAGTASSAVTSGYRNRDEDED